MPSLNRVVGRKTPGTVAAVVALIALLPAVSPALPQLTADPESAPGDRYKISVNVRLVVLPVTVMDRRGEFVPGLSEQNFQIIDDGRPQPISLFERGDVPVTVGLVVDNSGSMGPKRPGVVAASLAFVHSSSPGDQMFVVNISGRVSLGLPASMPFTNDPSLLREALVKQPPHGNTALYDGVAEGLEHLQVGTGDRKALIVVTDGGDNASRITLPRLVELAERANAAIYTIGILDQTYSDENPAVLRQLAKATGGQAYFPSSAAQVADVAEQIARTLREQYTLGYVPPEAGARASYHPIRVNVRAAGEGKLRVRTRAGYRIAPEPPPAPSQGK